MLEVKLSKRRLKLIESSIHFSLHDDWNTLCTLPDGYDDEQDEENREKYQKILDEHNKLLACLGLELFVHPDERKDS